MFKSVAIAGARPMNWMHPKKLSIVIWENEMNSNTRYKYNGLFAIPNTALHFENLF